MKIRLQQKKKKKKIDLDVDLDLDLDLDLRLIQIYQHCPVEKHSQGAQHLEEKIGATLIDTQTQK